MSESLKAVQRLGLVLVPVYQLVKFQAAVCVSQVKLKRSDPLRPNKETSEACWETNLLPLVFRGFTDYFISQTGRI